MKFSIICIFFSTWYSFEYKYIAMAEFYQKAHMLLFKYFSILRNSTVAVRDVFIIQTQIENIFN